MFITKQVVAGECDQAVILPITKQVVAGECDQAVTLPDDTVLLMDEKQNKPSNKGISPQYKTGISPKSSRGKSPKSIDKQG